MKKQIAAQAQAQAQAQSQALAPPAGKSQTYAEIYQKKYVPKDNQPNHANDSNHSTLVTVSGKHNFSSVQKELTKPNSHSAMFKKSQTSFVDNDQQLKQTLKSIHELRHNSPTFRTNNPITSEGHIEEVFRSSVKQTAYSNVDNIKSPPKDKHERKTTNALCGHLLGVTEQKDWKSSVKRVSQKESEHYEVFEKPGLKHSSIKASNCISNNPLLGEEEKALRLRLTGNGDQVISVEYQRMADRRDLASQNFGTTGSKWTQLYKQSNIFFDPHSPERPQTQMREHRNGVPNKCRGNEAKHLLGYDYALPFNKEKPLTEKVNRVQADRYLSYNQSNDYDFRRRSNVLGKEEVFALNSQVQNEENKSQCVVAQS